MEEPDPISMRSGVLEEKLISDIPLTPSNTLSLLAVDLVVYGACRCPEFVNVNLEVPKHPLGAAWTCQQLRNKSNEDLHKLWYVLLKERNMLLTLEQEAKRQRLPMPSPERLEKVVDSMDALDKVVQEREDALRLLQTGQERARPGAWRRDIFGRIIWHKFKQWPIPWHLNKRYNKKRFFAMPYVDHFVRLRIEKQARLKARKQSLEKKKEKRLQEKFPHLSEAQKSSSV
ncbi:39S ribosomal protein L47, mitochondrial [Sciurus carolinensis]|uniref:Large ribosomal subunit protein uL29m n=1 Tax=Sciurus carolinensis TaxID=30640 RepID=A0AA41NET7_SCICA|nr:39S ribosomal protein L47, mitochondrial [Sciurus carolinensis]